MMMRQRYVGKDRFKARELIVEDLDQAGQLEKVEDYINERGDSQKEQTPSLNPNCLCSGL